MHICITLYISTGITQIHDYLYLPCIEHWQKIEGMTALLSTLSAPTETDLVNFTTDFHPPTPNSQFSVPVISPLQPLRNPWHSKAPSCRDTFHFFFFFDGSLFYFFIQFQLLLFFFGFCGYSSYFLLLFLCLSINC